VFILSGLYALMYAVIAVSVRQLIGIISMLLLLLMMMMMMMMLILLFSVILISEQIESRSVTL